jgi:hypothetical protein
MIDLNVLLDFVQKREPHYHHSSIVLSEVLNHKVDGIVPAHALTTLHYLVAKYADTQRANEITDWLLAHFDIAPADKLTFVHARNLQFDDFEDPL